MNSVSRQRSWLARRLGWFAVAGLVAASFAPSAFAATVITHPTGNPDCADLGYSLTFKIDTGDLEERTYEWDEGNPVDSDWDGQSITITDLSDDGQTFSWTSTLAVSAVLVKAGSDNHNLYSYDPAVLGDDDLTRGDGQQGISHVSFCGDTPEPTNPPTEAPTNPPTDAPTEPADRGSDEAPTEARRRLRRKPRPRPRRKPRPRLRRKPRPKLRPVAWVVQRARPVAPRPGRPCRRPTHSVILPRPPATMPGGSSSWLSPAPWPRPSC